MVSLLCLFVGIVLGAYDVQLIGCTNTTCQNIMPRYGHVIMPNSNCTPTNTPACIQNDPTHETVIRRCVAELSDLMFDFVEFDVYAPGDEQCQQTISSIRIGALNVCEEKQWVGCNATHFELTNYDTDDCSGAVVSSSVQTLNECSSAKYGVPVVIKCVFV